MEVDGDLDQAFIQQFSCLGTTDKDVLIAELQKLLGNRLNENAASFYLDMNNWNLQAAICSYFDFECPNLPKMAFVEDVTIGEGDSIPPNTKFVKTWRIRNVGPDGWPPGCVLKFTGGHQMTTQDRALVDPMPPGATTDVSIEMTSPITPGSYQGNWMMSTATGVMFGEVIWVIVVVAEGGTLGLTQQLSQFNDLGSPINTSACSNPFASPSKDIVCRRPTEENESSPRHSSSCPANSGFYFPENIKDDDML